MIHQHDCQHRLGDWSRADAYTGVVSPGRYHLGRLPMHIDGTARYAQAGGGFQRDARDNILSEGDAAQYAAGVIGEKAFGCNFVAVLGALLLDTGKARPDLYSFHRVNAHQGMGNIRI